MYSSMIPRQSSNFQDNNLIIPITVIEEVDRFKKDMNETGRTPASCPAISMI